MQSVKQNIIFHSLLAIIFYNLFIMNRKNFIKNHFEKVAWKDKSYTCGIDEVGRGCLSGPLVVASVILRPDAKYSLLKDSKILTEQERNKAYDWINKNAFYSSVIIDTTTIDKKNIYQATRFAMKKSFMQLVEIVPFNITEITHLISDAVPLNIPTSYLHENLKLYNPEKAESISPTVAAASIVAKVTRDRLMKKLDKLFPSFYLRQHKGYGTKTHIQAIKKHGPSIIHRATFLSKILNRERNDQRQQTIC
jgi:ribonuclease HII